MRLLYVVFVVSLLALIWAAIAVTRHIRHHEAVRTRPEPGMRGQTPDDSSAPSTDKTDSK